MRGREENEDKDKTMKNIIVNFSFYLLFIAAFSSLLILQLIAFVIFPSGSFLSFLIFYYFISDENRQTNANKLIFYIIWMNELNVGESTRVIELIKMSMLIGN